MLRSKNSSIVPYKLALACYFRIQHKSPCYWRALRKAL